MTWRVRRHNAIHVQTLWRRDSTKLHSSSSSRTSVGWASSNSSLSFLLFPVVYFFLSSPSVFQVQHQIDAACLLNCLVQDKYWWWVLFPLLYIWFYVWAHLINRNFYIWTAHSRFSCVYSYKYLLIGNGYICSLSFPWSCLRSIAQAISSLF